MLVLRCTHKLLARLKSVGSEPSLRSTTRLGDWYGNTLSTGEHRLVLFVSESTFLPVVIPLRESRTMVARFRVALRQILQSLAVHSATIEKEIDEGGEVVIASTASRRVLGVMNDLAFQAKWIIDHRSSGDWLQLSLSLGEVPCGPLRFVHPVEAARKQLAHSETME